MVALLIILASGFGLCLITTPLIRVMAIRMGLLDNPDNRRKIHSQPIPRSGGMAVFLSTTVVVGVIVLLTFLLPESLGRQLPLQKEVLAGLFISALLICSVGVADDFGLIRGRHKLLGQVLAALIVISFGIQVSSIQVMGWNIDLGLLSIPFTVCFLLGAINSLNLIDGMDGLLGSVGLITCLTIAGMAALISNWTAVVVALALAGSLMGFLRYNLPPASVFLGDAGSMVIGLIIGTLAIQSSLKAPATIVLTTPLVLLTLPFFDTTAAIIRRKLTGRSIYSTDRGHLHHCLLRRGYSTRLVLVLVSICCLLTGLSVLASQAFDSELIGLFTGIAVVAILILTGLFGYTEALLIKERLLALGNSFLQPGTSGKARQLEIRLQGSVSWKTLWNTLVETANELNLKQLRLDVNSPALQEGYHARWDLPGEEKEVSTIWRMEIPLSAQGIDVGRLQVAGELDDRPIWEKLATINEVIENVSNNILPTKPQKNESPVDNSPQEWNGSLAEQTNPLASTEAIS